MANSEHIDLLRQGVNVWNKKWKSICTSGRPDFSGADLRGANLEGAELISANLNGANLAEANLKGATLVSAYLIRANISKADLTKATLMTADLSAANLHRAYLRKADVSFLSLSGADLSGADLYEADLCGTDLSRSNLFETNLTKAKVGQSIFGDLDLSVTKGLDTIRHYAPSSIGIDTIFRSKGIIPDNFLRGAGVPDKFITQIRSLAGEFPDYFTCFISYSSKDAIFAKRMYADLQSQSVRCWFAPEDMKIGDKIRQTLERRIRAYDKLLLILSRNSIDSDWVEKEVETAFEEERKRKTAVLFPIRVDNDVMDSDKAWAADLRRTRHIGDFTGWKDDELYKVALERLLRDLKENGNVTQST